MRPSLYLLISSALLVVRSPVALAQGADPRPAPQLPRGVVELHIDGPPDVKLLEHVGVGETRFGVASVSVEERFREVCTPPCDTVIDARDGRAFLIDAPGFPDPGRFTLQEMRGPVTLLVKPGDHGLVLGGRWLTALGVITTLIGGVAAPLTYSGALGPDRPFAAGSVGLLVGGAAALAIGIPLMIKMRTRVSFVTTAP